MNNTKALLFDPDRIEIIREIIKIKQNRYFFFIFFTKTKEKSNEDNIPKLFGPAISELALGLPSPLLNKLNQDKI